MRPATPPSPARGAGRPLIACLAAALLAATPPGAHGAPDFAGAMSRGLELLQGARFEEAAAAFREALEAEPASVPARRNLAAAWAGLGASQLRAGRLAQSRDSYEKAAEALPEFAEYHVRLAQVLFRLGDARAARQALDEALELEPDDAAALELSGDLHALEGRLSRALAAWEAAAQAGGSHALAEKIARGRREMDAEEGMERESSRYFIVLYDRDVPRPLVQDFFRLLDRAFDTLHDRLGDYPRDAITVLLYSQVAFRDVTLAPDWVGGTYDGKVRIPVGGLKTGTEASMLMKVLVHEMTHAFLHRMAPAGLPLWFNEGLATTFQEWDPAGIRRWFAEHPPEGLATLGDLDRTLRGRGGNVQAGYAAARLAVQEMEDLRGFGAVRRIIAAVGAGTPFEEAFRDEMRLDLAEFEERWRKGLR